MPGQGKVCVRGPGGRPALGWSVAWHISLALNCPPLGKRGMEGRQAAAPWGRGQGRQAGMRLGPQGLDRPGMQLDLLVAVPCPPICRAPHAGSCRPRLPGAGDEAGRQAGMRLGPQGLDRPGMQLDLLVAVPCPPICRAPHAGSCRSRLPGAGDEAGRQAGMRLGPQGLDRPGMQLDLLVAVPCPPICRAPHAGSCRSRLPGAGDEAGRQAGMRLGPQGLDRPGMQLDLLVAVPCPPICRAPHAGSCRSRLPGVGDQAGMRLGPQGLDRPGMQLDLLVTVPCPPICRAPHAGSCRPRLPGAGDEAGRQAGMRLGPRAWTALGCNWTSWPGSLFLALPYPVCARSPGAEARAGVVPGTCRAWHGGSCQAGAPWGRGLEVGRQVCVWGPRAWTALGCNWTSWAVSSSPYPRPSGLKKRHGVAR